MLMYVVSQALPYSIGNECPPPPYPRGFTLTGALIYLSLDIINPGKDSKYEVMSEN